MTSLNGVAPYPTYDRTASRPKVVYACPRCGAPARWIHGGPACSRKPLCLTRIPEEGTSDD